MRLRELPRLFRYLIVGIALILLGYISLVMFSVTRISQSIVEYEQILSPFPSVVCIGDDFSYPVLAHVKYGPSVVAVAENWISLVDRRQSYIDDSLQWRILREKGDFEFQVMTEVPEIPPGKYLYQRALGLNRSFLLELEMEVKPAGEC